ncbi:MAG: purine-binding chemotaxis protein CheW [Thiotrichaceae bacterium]|nr:purine-binding chemotaxis protein CheW [Thiotrichaceae bacterium]
MVSNVAATRQPVTELDKYLCFWLGKKRYAANILCIKEIMEHMEVTSIPMMPDFLCGVTNLRGKVVPVIDLGKRLGMDGVSIGRRTCIVIMEVSIHEASMDVGIMVDAVNQVADIAPDQIEAAPSFGGNLSTEFIEGMGKVGDDFVVILNIDRLLSLDDLNLLSSAGNAMPQMAADTQADDNLIEEENHE